jgi:membrane-associated phospholipid phosphatase
MEHQPSKWRPTLLISCNGAALLLLLSWVLPVTHRWWNQLDTVLFEQLNSTLTHSSSWRSVCAFFTSVEGDILLAALLLGLGLVYICRSTHSLLGRRLSCLITVGGIGLIGLFLIKDVALEHLWEVRRLSPSLVMPAGTYLYEAGIPLHIQGRSAQSFPSDHAFALFYAALFFLTHRARWEGAIAMSLAALYVTARCIAGGHWGTDILVGSTSAVAIVYSWAVGTPLYTLLTRCCEAYARQYSPNAHPIK